MHNETNHARPLAGRIVGWNAVFAALVAAALIAASMIQLRSGTPLSAGAEAVESAAADVSPAAVMPAVAAAPLPVQDAMAGQCSTVSESDSFRLTESGALSVPGFDTSLGTLNSVEVATSVGLASGGSYTNVLVNPFDFSVVTAGDFNASITGPGIAGSTASGFGLAGSQTVPPGETVAIDIGAILASNAEPSSTPAAYEGGSVTFPVASAGSLLLSAGGDSDATVRTTVTATVTVTYCYSPNPVSSNITVSKAVVAGGGAVVPSFNFVINCGGADVAFELQGGQEVTLPLEGVADGATCTVTESITEPGRWAPSANGSCGVSVDVTMPGRADFVNELVQTGSDAPATACPAAG